MSIFNLELNWARVKDDMEFDKFMSVLCAVFHGHMLGCCIYLTLHTRKCTWNDTHKQIGKVTEIYRTLNLSYLEVSLRINNTPIIQSSHIIPFQKGIMCQENSIASNFFSLSLEMCWKNFTFVARTASLIWFGRNILHMKSHNIIINVRTGGMDMSGGVAKKISNS